MAVAAAAATAGLPALAGPGLGGRTAASSRAGARAAGAGGTAERAFVSERKTAAGAEILKAYLGCLAVAFVLAVALSWSCSTSARLGYRIDELQAKLARLQDDNEKLSFELAGLQSMARVEEEATTRLGMVRPEYVRVGATGLSSQAAATSGSAASVGSAVVAGSAASPAEATARVIELGPAGPGDGEVARAASAAAPAGGAETGRESLWDRFYRWLTGVSSAEARDWD